MKVFNGTVTILYLSAKTQVKLKTGLRVNTFSSFEIIKYEKFIIKIFVTDMKRRTRHLNVCATRRLKEASASTRVPPLGRPLKADFLHPRPLPA